MRVLLDTIRRAYCIGDCSICGRAFTENSAQSVVTTRERLSGGLRWTGIAHLGCAGSALSLGVAKGA